MEANLLREKSTKRPIWGRAERRSRVVTNITSANADNGDRRQEGGGTRSDENPFAGENQGCKVWREIYKPGTTIKKAFKHLPNRRDFKHKRSNGPQQELDRHLKDLAERGW